MPNQPYLDPEKTKVDGLAFLGLSFTRNSPLGNPDSKTHQEAFDLNEVLDRDYEYLMSSNDDGWLAGGGEPGPPKSYKLAAKDSSHVEIMRVGTYRPDWGGITVEEIVKVMQSGKILIPQIEVLPTAVVANPDTPPELEIRFDMEPWAPSSEQILNDLETPLPVNWCLRFIHNQLFEQFQFASRFCPGPFHSTILRKADWRSPQHKISYFEKCQKAIEKWKLEGPKALNEGRWDIDGKPLTGPLEYTSGLWLFEDRYTITHFFPPNFLPPYNTPEKLEIIWIYIQNEWDADDLKFKPAGFRGDTDDHDGLGDYYGCLNS